MDANSSCMSSRPGPPLGSEQHQSQSLDHPNLLPRPRAPQRANKRPPAPPGPTGRQRGRVRSRRPESTAVMGVLVSGIMGGGATREGCGNRLKGKNSKEKDVCRRKSPRRPGGGSFQRLRVPLLLAGNRLLLPPDSHFTTNQTAASQQRRTAESFMPDP